MSVGVMRWQAKGSKCKEAALTQPGQSDGGMIVGSLRDQRPLDFSCPHAKVLGVILLSGIRSALSVASRQIFLNANSFESNKHSMMDVRTWTAIPDA